MDLQEIMQKDQKYYMNTFGKRVPVCFTHGRECLYGIQRERVSGFFSGIAVSALGHSHPAVVKAICEQAQK